MGGELDKLIDLEAAASDDFANEIPAAPAALPGRCARLRLEVVNRNAFPPTTAFGRAG